MAPYPVGPGASLAYPGGGDYIYALRGAAASQPSTDFWRYSTSRRAWEWLAAAPWPITNGGGLVYPGSGDFLYAAQGRSAGAGFARYSLVQNTWTPLAWRPLRRG